MTYEKPSLEVSEVEEVLVTHMGSRVTEITPMAGGNLSSVFSFSHERKEYVIKFSNMEGAYQTEQYISDMLSSQGIPFPRCIGKGEFEQLTYSIMERIDGDNLADCSTDQQTHQLPELIRILTRLNHVDIGSTSGYGWIGSNGEGAFPSWKDYMVTSFAEDQLGNFWENWHELFKSSFLEKDVFDECYSRLIAYIPYNEPHRHFIHGDFHQWNILSDGTQITGIIDGNCAYGDFLVDLAVIDRHMEGHEIIRAYQDYQEKVGIVIPNFKERLIGAYYFKELDGLRFCAKMGWKDAYNENRNFLLNLTN